MEQERKNVIIAGLVKPFTTLKLGLRLYYEKYFEKKIKVKYGITQLPTLDMLDLFPNLDETINRYSYMDGVSWVPDIVLLKSLARKFDNCNYLEIGSWRGESIANVAEVAVSCTSVTLSPEEMKAFNFHENFIKMHAMFSNDKQNIKTIHQNSQTFDFTTLGEQYDLIFIDGDHTYSGVLNDTVKTFGLRKNNKSVIVWHDYGFTTETPRHSVIAAILDGIPKDKHKNLYHVSNSLCAIYIEDAPGKPYVTQFPSFPNKKFTINVKAEKL